MQPPQLTQAGPARERPAVLDRLEQAEQLLHPLGQLGARVGPGQFGKARTRSVRGRIGRVSDQPPGHLGQGHPRVGAQLPDAVVGPGRQRIEILAGHRHASSSSTAPSARTPVTQSAASANSDGLWLTPVGLRTKSIAAGTRADKMPASWPAPAGRAGRPPAPAATRSRRAPSKSTPGVYDSALTLTSTPWATADDSAAAVISATTAATAPSSGARTSSQPSTAEAMALVPPGTTMIFPKVASAPARPA